MAHRPIPEAAVTVRTKPDRCRLQPQPLRPLLKLNEIERKIVKRQVIDFFAWIEMRREIGYD